MADESWKPPEVHGCQIDNLMNILTPYFTVSCLFTFAHKGMMYIEVNSITLFTATRTVFVIPELCKRRVHGHCLQF